MQILLIGITCVALVLTAAMGVLLLRRLREDGRRSDARVAALAAAAGASTSSARASASLEPAPHAPRPRAARVDPASDLELRPAATEHPEIFAPREQPSPWGARLAVAGVLATLVLAAAYLVPGSDSVPAPDAAAAPASAADPARGPLELLSLTHARQEGAIVISGLVQNPGTGAPLRDVLATGIAFGAGGEFLASGRAGLDFRTLAPGDESPFVVTIPVTGRVARYRVGFRTDDGEVIAHVDRRSASEALARK